MENTSEKIPSVAELNRDMEPYVIQASVGRNPRFGDKHKVLQFVHFTDVHHMLENWNRIVEYVNTYSEYIQFALHSGDYCGCSHTEYYCDLYGKGEPCVRPILNCLGGHDVIESYANQTSTPEETYPLCFPKENDWDAVFMPGEYSMNYYKDFPESNLRLIVLDQYFAGEKQDVWLREVLDDALEKGFHVVTSAHMCTHPIVKEEEGTFHTADDFFTLRPKAPESNADHIIAAFREKGGMHVCHLSGDLHTDHFGFTEHGVLQVVAPCATPNPVWSDGTRVRGTRTYDCFNVVAVDTDRKLLKLVRIGNQLDHYLRPRRAMCWDYGRGKLISNL